MDDRYSPKTSQKADVRPISFVLDNQGDLLTPVMLPIRPEDLTRSEPQRAAVHQTLGRGVQGWVDNFGEGLPTVTISGHTGWGFKTGTGYDGAGSFERLNELIVREYPATRQLAIDFGRDPGSVKLLFIDLLDDCAWHVEPMQFNLRRSKSSPLLFRYNIVMQAVSTSVDGGLSKFFPQLGNATAGLASLDGALGNLFGMITSLQSSVFSVLRPIANTVLGYVNFAYKALRQVQTVANAATGFINGTAGLVIGIGKSIAQVGREIFHTFAAIAGIGVAAKSAFMRAAATFNEIVCVFSNSLRPGATYQDYEGLYGASNCSSTTGGRMPSAFTDSNVFSVIAPGTQSPVSLSGAAIGSFSTITKSDPALAPLPQAEISRHLDNIVTGTVVWT